MWTSTASAKSYEGMIIGRSDQMLKRLPPAARITDHAEELLGVKVNLQCWSKC